MVCSISTASIKVKQVSPWAHIIKELEERLLGLYLGLCSRVEQHVYLWTFFSELALENPTWHMHVFTKKT